MAKTSVKKKTKQTKKSAKGKGGGSVATAFLADMKKLLHAVEKETKRDLQALLALAEFGANPAQPVTPEPTKAELAAERLTDKLLEIQHAKKKLGTKFFGFCEATGKALDPKQLFAKPYARYAAAHERAMAKAVARISETPEKGKAAPKKSATKKKRSAPAKTKNAKRPAPANKKSAKVVAKKKPQRR